jgi:phospho-N-acetylmuramoyl-pentapeptide-transferase
MPKANLFMGDTGSLALGAFYSMVALYLDSIYSFILMALLIIFETISVILQVFYYKKTNGKRLFKMAPFHHHLEAIGYNEIGIDLIFYTIEAILVSIVIFIN